MKNIARLSKLIKIKRLASRRLQSCEYNASTEELRANNVTLKN